MLLKPAATVALFVAVAAAPAPAAPAPTRCAFSVVVSLSPGLSLVPSTGEFTSGGETGTVSCDGVVRGVRPVGPGTLGVVGRYGTNDPDTCLDGEGEGRFSFTFPTADGEGRRSNVFAFSFGLLRALTGGPSGEFSGQGFSGTIEVQPEEGNCLVTPVTRVSIRGQGTITEQ
ncbi:MAG TPA: hypothetical protein VJS45_09890 [Acidimicrobiia bacterium]|nr:hypothetical protein [Acidimicrobiia bacterium]